MKFLILFVVLTSSCYGWAFSFSPSVMVLEPKGKKKSGLYTITNTQKTRVALELTQVTRNVDSSGKETLEPVEHFKIFPKSFSLDAGQKRRVKIIYTGPPDVKEERAYRIVARQLQVDFSKEKQDKAEISSSLNFLFKYETSLYVKPKGVKPKVKVEYKKSEKSHVIEVKNSGSEHKTFQKYKIVLTGKDGITQELNSGDSGIFPPFNVLAKNKRVFDIPDSVLTVKAPQKVEIVDLNE
jgi:P pilus assembly chaperone PapD